MTRLQVLVPSSPTTANELCRIHSEIFLERLQRFDMWALKMFDSSAKLPAGLLNGNVNQYGDFDQCLDVAEDLDPVVYSHLEDHHIAGKFCLAHLDMGVRSTTRSNPILKEVDDLVHAHRPIISTVNDPGHRIARFSTVSWGFCVPVSCSAEDLEKSLIESLETLLKDTPVTLSVKVDPDMCYVKDLQPITAGTKVTVALFIFILGLVGFGTWIDTGQRSPKEGKTVRLLKAFSLKKNFRTLLKTENVSNDFACLHGIRTLNAVALIVFHKSVALYFNPYVNRTYMAETFSKSWSVIGRTSIIYTDSFIFISGFLTSHSLLAELDSNKKINICRKYFSRYMRITPNLVAVILFCTHILNHLGSGPQWNLVVKRHSDFCQRNMWRNLLYIHNYFGFEDMCLTHTHQLAVDMQLYVVTPILVYVLWSRRWLGLSTVVLTCTVSSILRYAVTYDRKLSTVVYFGTPVSQFFDTARLSYSLPTHRASMYLFGVAVRYLIHETKPKFSLNKIQILTGWIVSGAMGLLAMCGPYHMSFPSYRYSPQEAALYSALSPILWGAFLGWLTFAESMGYSGILGRALSWKGFAVFARISYSVYLTQFPIFFYNVGTRRTATSYSPHLLFEVGEVASIILASILLTLVIDLPFQEVKKILWKEEPRIFQETKESKSQEYVTESN
ncbi:Nose resistant to fluoxetine protein 6 [Zootermopsis nevadensis]|uniref:Nose resistant to fluoxetine protein 6 n=1 Tax=Zootermopsis nevadensis TaxID=136037 RepID=A0A067RNE3_ZOONE|nr:Nose resistant to fluoxetine protein 6 [Zootermopsis nevadensis]